MHLLDENQRAHDSKFIIMLIVIMLVPRDLPQVSPPPPPPPTDTNFKLYDSCMPYMGMQQKLGFRNRTSNVFARFVRHLGFFYLGSHALGIRQQSRSTISMVAYFWQCGNTTPEGRSVFIQFRVFPTSTSVVITIYQYGKNVLYFFYNIAMSKARRIRKISVYKRRKISRVDIELYQHGA